MKKLFPHISSIVLVVIGFLLCSILTGNNAIAQKLAALTGSGTPGRLAKWASQSGLGNSGISEDKNGVVSISNGIKFPDGSMQTTASTDSHFQQLKFKQALGQEREIQLPKADCPVRVDVSIGNIIIARTGAGSYPEQAVPPMTLEATFSIDSLTSIKSNPVAVASSRTGPCEVFTNTEFECQRDVVAFLFNKITITDLNGSIVIKILPSVSSGVIIPHGDFDVCVNMWY
jgi:hypothetical protein